MPQQPNKLKVLIIDKDQQELIKFHSALTNADFEVTTLAEDDCALEKTQEIMPDVILIDLNTVDGFALCKAIKENQITKGINVIFLSPNKFDEADVTDGFHLGAIDYLPHHIDVKSMINRIAMRTSAELLYKANREYSTTINHLAAKYS